MNYEGFGDGGGVLKLNNLFNALAWPIVFISFCAKCRAASPNLQRIEWMQCTLYVYSVQRPKTENYELCARSVRSAIVCQCFSIQIHYTLCEFAPKCFVKHSHARARTHAHSQAFAFVYSVRAAIWPRRSRWYILVSSFCRCQSTCAKFY